MVGMGRGETMAGKKEALVLGSAAAGVFAGLAGAPTTLNSCPGDCPGCRHEVSGKDSLCAPEGQQLCRGSLRECTGLGRLLKVCDEGAQRRPCPGPIGGPCALAPQDPQAQTDPAYASAAAAEPSRLALDTLPRASFQRLPDIDR